MLGVGAAGAGWRRMSRAPSTAAPSTDGSSSAAVSSLTSTWPAFASSSSSAVRLAAGPLTTSSRCSAGSPTRKKWKVPLCRPTDILQLHPPADDWARPAVRSSVAHVHRGADRPGGVVGAAEQQQDGVATPLHQVAPLAPRVGQQRAEDGMEDVAQLLRADRPLPGQPPREGGEPGDVDEGHRALDGAGSLVGMVPQPLDGQVRDVGTQRVTREVAAAVLRHPPPHAQARAARTLALSVSGASAVPPCSVIQA